MSLVRWTPLIEPSWFDDNDFFDAKMSNASFTLAIDVYQTENEVVIEAPLAGIDPAKVEVAVENDVLTIKGKHEKKTEVDDKNYYRKEIRSGSFYRAVQLPAHVAGSDAKAQYDKGVLKVTVPKAPEAKLKTIRIDVKEK